MSGDQENSNAESVEMLPKKEKKKHRFHVAKVDFSTDSPSRHTYADDEDAAEKQPLTETERSVGSVRSHDSRTTSPYDSHNVRSLRHYTREAFPRADHYRNVMSIHGHVNRPTLDELHDASSSTSPDSKYRSMRWKDIGHYPVKKAPGGGAVKLGWIQGVFVRCLLNIWGVMLFLRLSWVVGQAGIGLGSLVVLLSSVVTVLTTVSMSAICTNGEVRGGGTYYMISRSLGPEFGGSIGVLFALANAVAVAMYVVGFSEPLVELLMNNGLTIVDGSMNDVRIIGCITCLVLFLIAVIGTEWESKAQLVLLAILLVSMVDFVIGSVIPPGVVKQSKGYVGWDTELMAENFGPDFRGETFISVFSVFFPAATGILAGANISGDLADPQMAIPKGTFLAIIITTITYVWFAFTSGATVLRDANGLLGLDEHLVNESMVNFTAPMNISSGMNISEDFVLTRQFTQNCSLTDTGKCKYGLHNHYEVMELVAAFGPIIYAGIFAATLSSALASLVSAPKVFQALCKDKLFPHIEGFAKGYGKSDEPRKAYVLAFLIALACTAIGELNAIAPIISNFFLAAYCLINFSCFHATFGGSPGFRPAFKYYNMWVSLLGAVVCLSVMFIMNWWTALLTFALILMLYTFIHYRKPDVNWGSSTQAQTYKTALNSVFKLNQQQEHVKNYRPQILVLSGSPGSRPPLVDFTYLITKKLSLMICGQVINNTSMTQRERGAYVQQAYKWLQKRKVRSFYTLVEDEVFSHGAQSLMQLVGVGKMRPNVLFMGYKSNWQDSTLEEVEDYFNVVHEAFNRHLALGILRLPEGLDYSEYNDLDDTVAVPMTNGKDTNKSTSDETDKTEVSENNITHDESDAQLSQDNDNESSPESSPPSTPTTERANVGNDIKSEGDSKLVRGSTKGKDKLSSVNHFQRKQKKGTVDVWWLYDDGGLTILLPYLLSTHSQFANCKLRVFSLANRKDDLEEEQRSMAALLNKFRIDYADVKVIPDVTKPPQESSKEEFDQLITKWKENELAEEETPGLINSAELLAVRDKTYRHLRLREILLEHSKDASLIVMTLPMPRKGTCSSPMYMAWLETLTSGMPPFLLIRGNQTSVLTFYS